MSEPRITFSVFTKPWKLPLAELGKLIKGIGFDGIELPVRPGFQVEPQYITRDLPPAVKLLAEYGLSITSVATQPTAEAIQICGELGIPLIRVMVEIGASGYLASVEKA